MSVYFYGCISIDGYLALIKIISLDWLHDSGSVETAIMIFKRWI